MKQIFKLNLINSRFKIFLTYERKGRGAGDEGENNADLHIAEI